MNQCGLNRSLRYSPTNPPPPPAESCPLCYEFFFIGLTSTEFTKQVTSPPVRNLSQGRT